MTRQLAFYIDTSSCAKCKACQIACQDKNNLPADTRWRRVIPYEGGSWIPDPDHKDLMRPSGVFSYSVSISCMHCQNPICAEVCPVNLLPQQLYWHAKHKDLEKVQQFNLFDCIECGACSFVCPSAIPLVQYYRAAKTSIRRIDAEKQKADRARERQRGERPGPQPRRAPARARRPQRRQHPLGVRRMLGAGRHHRIPGMGHALSRTVLEPLAQAIVSISNLATTAPEVVEAEANPLQIHQEGAGVLALDALVRTQKS